MTCAGRQKGREPSGFRSEGKIGVVHALKRVVSLTFDHVGVASATTWAQWVAAIQWCSAGATLPQVPSLCALAPQKDQAASLRRVWTANHRWFYGSLVYASGGGCCWATQCLSRRPVYISWDIWKTLAALKTLNLWFSNEFFDSSCVMGLRTTDFPRLWIVVPPHIIQILSLKRKLTSRK